MLGTAPEIRTRNVQTGLVQLVFWPVISFGEGSRNAHAAAHCVGLQDSAAFWSMVTLLFVQQNEIGRADEAQFTLLAQQAGVDAAAFGSCYADGIGHAQIDALDRLRQDRGVFSQPTFEINGERLFGNQPYTIFVDFFSSLLE